MFDILIRDITSNSETMGDLTLSSEQIDLEISADFNQFLFSLVSQFSGEDAIDFSSRDDHRLLNSSDFFDSNERRMS
ncbi:hypothetical protein WICPIJ_007353 [Wickerhamomyces pijperi]|uniref:Uncharacterized protein n=1 Tax=Wickerhamomyces pijperi TaxID=599730 RepID=A0A9P8Q2L7_WICPI|nr:hypothetical protein WICPIJ_007353 [Wickerhamomyces pijperi]